MFYDLKMFSFKTGSAFFIAHVLVFSSVMKHLLGQMKPYVQVEIYFMDVNVALQIET